MKKFFNEFKEFALRGNVFDMAIGVVIGGAFTGIVNSLVTDIFTPFISLIANTSNLEDLKFVLKAAVLDANNEVIQEAVTLNYGRFINTVISFVIIAFVIFSVIKGLNKLTAAKEIEEAQPEAAPQPSEEVLLLQKIYEELKKD